MKTTHALIALGLAAFAARAAAAPGFSYGGRLADGNDIAVPGPVDLELRFYRTASGGSPVGNAVAFSSVPLEDGIFQVDVAEVAANLLDGDVWVEVKDLTHAEVYPRQKLVAMPLALRVPVDGKRARFDATGSLTIGPSTPAPSGQFLTTDADGSFTWSAPPAGGSNATTLQGRNVSATAPSSDQVLKWTGSAWAPASVPAPAMADISGLSTALSAKADAAATTSALAGKANTTHTHAQTDVTGLSSALASKADSTHSHTLAGDVTGDVGSTVVSSLQGAPLDSATPSTGHVLKWDGTKWTPAPDDGGVTGAISSGTNVGGGVGLFRDVTAPNLNFRTLSGGTNVDVTTSGDSVVIASTPGLTASAQAGVVLNPYAAASGNTGEIRFQELAASGSHYVGFKAPDSLAGNVVWTLPGGDGTSGQVLQTDGTGGLSWVSGSAPTGAAGGDLTGNFPNPTLASSGVTAGTYPKVTVDAKGRVTSGSSTITATDIADGTIADADIADTAAIADSKLATITTAGKVSDSALSSNVTKLGLDIDLGTSETTGILTTAKGGTGQDGSVVAANQVLASPSGSSGSVSYRALSQADIPSLTAAKISDFASAVAAADGVGTIASGYVPRWNGTELVSGSVSDSGTGNVGIGTSAMSYPLTVSGSTSPQVALVDGATQMKLHASGTTGMATILASQGIHLAPNYSVLATLTSNGLGIGSTSPIARLEVVGQGSSSSTQALAVKNGTFSQLLTVLDSGNVGIGTSNPFAKLHVNGQLRADNIMFPDGSMQSSGGLAVVGGCDMNGAWGSPSPAGCNAAGMCSSAASAPPNMSPPTCSNGAIWHGTLTALPGYHGDSGCTAIWGGSGPFYVKYIHFGHCVK